MDKFAAAIVGLLLLTACSQSAAPQQQSHLEEKMKCKQYGESQFENLITTTSSTVHNFYYSSALDTCVRETYFDSNATDRIIFALHDMLTEEVLKIAEIPCNEGELADYSRTCTIDDYNEYRSSILD